MKKIEWWCKFSIFGKNSRILKVLAHEISDEIQKTLKKNNFHDMIKRGNNLNI